MKRKLLFLLLNLCFIFTLTGCKEEEIETVSDNTITITVSKSELELKEEDSTLQLEEPLEEEIEIPEEVEKVYSQITDFYDFSNYSVLNNVTENQDQQYIYFEDYNLAKLLYELKDSYYFVFETELETNQEIYVSVTDFASLNHITEFLPTVNETESIEINTEENTDVVENEENLEETTVEEETNENSEENNNLEEEPLEESDSSEETITHSSDYPYQLYRFKSVSVYSLDKDLLIKDATKEADFSFIMNS